MLAAFGVGLLLTFTPCVLPMVPILSGIIVGASGDQTRHQAARRAAVVQLRARHRASPTPSPARVAGATGGQLQAYFQNPWAIGTFATLLVLLALSMFGLLRAADAELHPVAAALPLSTTAGQAAARLLGAFILGLVSALIVGACVSPVLIVGAGRGDRQRRTRCSAAACMFAHGPRPGRDPGGGRRRRRLPAAQGRAVDGPR
ncbi:MAG: hypothetical protein MZV65_37540 [Chromatiales bacterium]|nr:hypothetical protein [Chromatiales bacterium]